MFVESVKTGGAAHKAGLLERDMIVKVGWRGDSGAWHRTCTMYTIFYAQPTPHLKHISAHNGTADTQSRRLTVSFTFEACRARARAKHRGHIATQTRSNRSHRNIAAATNSIDGRVVAAHIVRCAQLNNCFCRIQKKHTHTNSCMTKPLSLSLDTVSSSGRSTLFYLTFWP